MAPTTVTETQMSDARRLISWGVVQAVLVDNKEPVSGHLQDVLERCVQENLLQCEKWTRTLFKDLLASNTAVANIQTLNDHMADYLTQSFRQRHSSLSSGPVERGRPTEPHINVLQKMNHDLSRYLKLEGTVLLDRLYECDMMSESERQSILAKSTTKRKNEAFIEFLCSNFTTEKFKASILPILSDDEVHIDLAERIVAELEAASTNSETIRCTFCKMKALVNPRKLSEVLFEQNSISLSVKHDLCLSTHPNSSKWELLLKSVQKEEKLQNALEKSYRHLFREFQETGHSALLCCCFNVSPDVAKMSDFTSNDSDSISKTQISDPRRAEEDSYHHHLWTHSGRLRTNLDHVTELNSISDISEYILKQYKELLSLQDEQFTKELQISTGEYLTRVRGSRMTLQGLLLLIPERQRIIGESERFKTTVQTKEKEIAEFDPDRDAAKLAQAKLSKASMWEQYRFRLTHLEGMYLEKELRINQAKCVII